MIPLNHHSTATAFYSRIHKLRFGFALIGIISGLSTQLHAQEIAQFYAFKDVAHLNGNLKKASDAVIKLLDATASFVCVNSDVYLMTNHHVLGSHNCAADGCYARAHFEFKKNTPSHTQLMHLRPVAANANSDIAFYALPSSYSPPHCLPLALSSQQGDAVTLIGHPRGGVKKYSKGQIIESWGGFIHVSAFSLPGSSGSPIVNRQGQLVGIHHSSIKRNDMFTRTEILYRGRGSSLQTIKTLLTSLDSQPHNQPHAKPKRFISISKPVDFAQAKARSRIYRQGRLIPKIKGPYSFFSRLYKSCKQEVKSLNSKVQTLKSIQNSLSSCEIARSWIGCSTDTITRWKRISAARLEHCPATATREPWQNLFIKIAQHLDQFYGDHSFKWWLAAMSIPTHQPHPQLIRWLTMITKPALQHKGPAYKPRILKQLSQIMAHHSLTHHPQLSAYINDHMPKLKATLINYRQIKGFWWHLAVIAKASDDLYIAGYLSQLQRDQILRRIINEPKSTLNTVLLAEKLKYQSTAQPSHHLLSSQWASATVKF